MYKKNGEFTLSIEPGESEFFVEVFPTSPPSHFSNAVDKLINRYFKIGVRVHVILPVTSNDDISSMLPRLNGWTQACSSIIFDTDIDCATNLESLLKTLNDITIPCDKHVSFSSSIANAKRHLNRIKDFSEHHETAFTARCSGINEVSRSVLDHLLSDTISIGIKVIEFDRDHHSTFSPATYRQFLSEIYDLHRRNFDSAYVDYFPSWKSALWPLFFHELGRLCVQHLPAEQYGCSLGRRTVAFDSSDTQIPCGRYHKMVGKIIPQSFQINLPYRCFECPVYNVCEGGCKALAFGYGQTIYDPHCWR